MNERPLPHDLLWGMRAEMLAPDAPAWAVAALNAGHPVVVRRAHDVAECIAVGLRGSARHERLAAWMPVAQIQRRVRPEGLLASRLSGMHPVFLALSAVQPVLGAHGLTWGVTGSAGYALATGLEVLTPDSDLDLLIRAPVPLTRDGARTLLGEIEAAACCRVDIQLETPLGGLALREWAGSSERVMVKTAQGPHLVSSPWSLQEQAA